VTMRDLRAADVDIVTLGQYLRPSTWHLPVQEFVPPDTFDGFRAAGEAMGFAYVAAGPLVRSSYRAGEFFLENVIRDRRARGG
jgi:lipoyl synthase